MLDVETLFRTWHLTLHLGTTALHNMHVLMKINCPLWFVFTAFNAELQIIELKQLADIFLHFQTLCSHYWILHETKRIQKGKPLREHKLNKKIYASIQVTQALTQANCQSIWAEYMVLLAQSQQLTFLKNQFVWELKINRINILPLIWNANIIQSGSWWPLPLNANELYSIDWRSDYLETQNTMRSIKKWTDEYFMICR